METLQDRSTGPDADSSAPSSDGTLGRIAGETQGLIDDLREWIDLRLDLAVIEMEERVDKLRNEVTLGLTLAVLGFFAGLFVLTTLALGLGWALGRPFWGFLIVAAVLVVIVGGLASARPNLAPPSQLFKKLRGDRHADAEQSPTQPAPEDEPVSTPSDAAT